MNRLAKKSLRSYLSQRRRAAQVADNFSTQYPEIVYVPASGQRAFERWQDSSTTIPVRRHHRYVVRESRAGYIGTVRKFHVGFLPDDLQLGAAAA
jgi:hypothetical protein